MIYIYIVTLNVLGIYQRFHVKHLKPSGGLLWCSWHGWRFYMSSPGYATGQNWGSLKSEWLSTMDMAWYDKNIQTPVVLSCKFLHTNTSGSKSDKCIQLITIVYNCHQTLFDLQPGMMIPAQLTVVIFQGLKPRSGPQISRQVQSFVHVLRALPQAKAQLRAGLPSKCMVSQSPSQVMPEVLKQDILRDAEVDNENGNTP